MATPTYVALATTTTSGGESTITFSSIPSTYRDLYLVMTPTGTGYPEFRLRFNGDTGANYSYVRMFGDSGGDSSSSASTTFISCSNLGDDSMGTVAIMDYSATDKHKTTLGRQGRSDVYALAIAGRWANTAAITSVTIALSSGTFSAGGVLSLYGIEA